MGEPTLKTLWNMDDAVLKAICRLKLLFTFYMQMWKLDDAYWILRIMRAEMESKLKEEEQDTIEAEMEKLEQTRKNYLIQKIKRGEFFLVLENYYILLNRLMKKHGLYFREKDDPRFAVLKR